MPFDVSQAIAIECTPETPWGIHPAVVDDSCPRCGWAARVAVGGAALPPPEGQAGDG